MSRYIDADALIEKFKAEHDWSSVYIVEDMPTADVIEVVHGQWTDTTHGLICSACKTYQVYGSRFYKFCPICGADMRGGTDDTQT